MTKRFPVLVTALVMGLAITGCSGDAASGDASSGVTRTEPKSTPLPSHMDLGPSPAGIAKDVKITECPTAKGAVVAKGTAKNSGKKPTDMSIMVIWLKSDSGNPLGSGIAALKQVKPGESKDWSVKATLVADADRCVLNALAGTAEPSGNSSASASAAASTSASTGG